MLKKVAERRKEGEEMKPVLRYPGSKWRIAKEIVDLIPEHHSYIEPYFGSGAILFSKYKSNIETINDLDDDDEYCEICDQRIDWSSE